MIHCTEVDVGVEMKVPSRKYQIFPHTRKVVAGTSHRLA